MDPHLLETYNQELIYMREMAIEFAKAHPKIAKRLGMNANEIADPYVERLIEAFCFMSARVQIKLDAEFPKFTQRLLEVIYPNYVSPTPSISVAQFHPSVKEGDFSKGFIVPRHTILYSKVAKDEVTSCEFRTSQDVCLWPIEISEAKLTGVPPDIPRLEQYLPAHVQVAGALRIKIKTIGELNFSDLKGLNRLPIYLSGEESIASHLFELLHTSSVASFIGCVGKIANNSHVVTKNALEHEGLSPEQSLLPLAWNTLHGHNLIHEYFACSSKFYFFALCDLAPGLSKINSNEAEIVVLLNRKPGNITNLTDKFQFSLFCTPIINLFPRRIDRLEINNSESEFHLVADRSRPMDFEIFSITEMNGQLALNTANRPFRALFQTLNQDEGNYGAYFSLRRERRLSSDTGRKYGTRTSYVGTEVFVSLVDQNDAPFSELLRYLSLNALLTNRDLPCLIPRNGYSDLTIGNSVPVSAVGMIRPPSMPQTPFAERELSWRLIRQLGFNYLPLSELSEREAAQGLRDMLRLFVSTEDSQEMRQIQSLVGASVKPVIRRLPCTGPLVYGRGVQCTITVNEDGFSGVSPFLFGLILEHYLSRHVSINSFTQTELQSTTRGKIALWDVRSGSRGAI